MRLATEHLKDWAAQQFSTALRTAALLGTLVAPVGAGAATLASNPGSLQGQDAINISGDVRAGLELHAGPPPERRQPVLIPGLSFDVSSDNPNATEATFRNASFLGALVPSIGKLPKGGNVNMVPMSVVNVEPLLDSSDNQVTDWGGFPVWRVTVSLPEGANTIIPDRKSNPAAIVTAYSPEGPIFLLNNPETGPGSGDQVKGVDPGKRKWVPVGDYGLSEFSAGIYSGD